MITRRNFLLLWRRSKTTDTQDPPILPKPILRNKFNPLPPLTARVMQDETEIPLVLRPPGALHQGLFEITCEGCGQCATACPTEAIFIPSDGPDAGMPQINPTHNPCLLCDGLKCTHACPSGALQPLTTPNEVNIGTAIINPTYCTAWRGLPCRICFDVCPIPEVLNLARGERVFVPVAGEAPCVGCGVCQYHCPAEGAIQIIPNNDGISSRVQLAINNMAE